MTRTYRKNILRTFKSARSRFVAIFSIVALGVGFLAGLNSTPMDMKESMETYLDDANFYDLRIVSTMGLTDEDVEALRQVEGVRAVQPAYSADLLVNAGADVVVSRVQSLPPEGEDAINHVVLADGRWPEKSGECVVEAGANLTDTNYPIGTQLTISSENEDLDTKLACTEYTVVGIVHNANYFSFEREPASVGNGTVDLVMYLQPEDFAYETYTEIYVTAQGALEQNSMGDAYEATVEAVEANVEAIQQERCEARYAETRAEGQQEINDAWAEYYDAEAEAQQELADAAAELEDGRKELADGEQEYWDGEQEYADGVQEVADNEATVNDGDAQLEDGRQELLDNQAKIEEGEAELAANAPKLEDARRQLEAGQAEYESGLEQYNEALQKLTDGEEALAAGKKQLDAAEEDYAEGLAQLVQGINLLLQTQNPEMEGTVSAEDVQGFIDWLLDNELPTPESYDEALDDLDAYLAPMGLSAADLSLTSAAREVQQKAQQMLDDLMAQLPPTGGEEESASESDETVQAEPEEEPSETPAPSDMAEEEPAEETNPDEPETEGKTLPEAPAETAEETAEPEIEEAGQEEAVQEPAASEKGAPAEEAALQEMTSEPQAATDSEAAPAEAQPCTEEAAPKEKAPQQTVVATGDQLAEEEQMQQLIQQLTAIVQSDRSQMADTLAAAQNWLDQQAQPWPGAVTYFAKLVAGGQQGLETEQEKMGFFMEGFAETVDGRRTLDTSWEAYYANEKKLSDGRKQLEDSAVQLRDAQKELEDGWAEYRDGVAEYEAGKKELADGRVQLEDGWATLTDKQIQLDDARRQLEDAKAELADARAELDDARATIAENAQKLRDGEIEYEDAKAEAEQELADARAEIEDGQRELDDIEMPEWYIWDRSNNVSFSSFTGNVDKLTAITTIFPVFFFLVAALVVSTTMTRMVEEERLQIGTMKALGYTRREIMQKYLWYAFAAAVSGTVVGLAIGFKAFPTIIWSAYTMMYYMPELATPWRLTQALFAGGTLTVLTVGVTALACRASLSEVPASLMLPRAPKAGKRILLERI
ncbi:FtsX-like permease family protein, partial [uncultured Subdoligranulum sp.]|uniref:FtsX-like permease family protein n=1 Tax=uncultured Subdoligranulum sp. TaxID=512298 RepID=UPI00262AF9D4